MKYDPRLKFSSLLSGNLHMSYDSISELFTQLEGITLEKYIISKRLEKVKALLVYSDFTLTEIAYMTGFSSINHLSGQFKELTGLSPSHFKSAQAQQCH
jgi:AraC-like DNA-binding protein